MVKLKYNTLLLLLLSCCMACSNDIELISDSTEEGYLSLRSFLLEQDGEMIPVTKSVDATLWIDIWHDEAVIEQYEPGTAPDELKLSTGSYQLKAYTLNWEDEAVNNELGNAAFFESVDFEIKAGELTTLDVVVPFVNLGVMLQLPDQFESWFTDYTLTVTSISGRSVNLKAGETAFFNLPDDNQLSYSFSVMNSDNEEFRQEKSIDVQKGRIFALSYTF